MIYEFLQPVSEEINDFVKNLSNLTIGGKIILHTSKEFPNLDKVSIAIICVNENRGNEIEINSDQFNNFRKSFYSLFPGNWKKEIADLGTLEAGESLSDTYFALKEIVCSLIKNKIIPIVVGGSQDLTYAMFRAYDQLDQMVNLVCVDSKLDIRREHSLESNAYLTDIIMNEPNNLFNFSNIGLQTYYNSSEEMDLMERLYFESIRLGDFITDNKVCEPIFRDADLVSIDFDSIKSSDSGKDLIFTPNGFDGREICKIARYTGISDKISAIGIFNSHLSEKESILLGQMVWYIMEGINFRSYEYPFESKDKYFKFNVLAEDEELIFYKSNRSERWWIEINFTNTYNKSKSMTLLPCTHNDYEIALRGEIPAKWWKFYQKAIN